MNQILMIASLLPILLVPREASAREEPREAGISVPGKRKAIEDAAPLRKTRLPLEFGDERPEAVLPAPDGWTDALYAQGEIFGQKLGLILGRSSAEAPAWNRVAFDRDGDGNIGPAEEHEISALTRLDLRDGGVGWTATVSGLEFPVDGAAVPFGLEYRQLPERALSAYLLVEWYLEGRVTLDGTEFLVVFQDADGDGGFGGEKDRFGVLPAEAPEARELRSSDLFAAGERAFVDGRRIGARIKEGTLIEVTHVRADGPAAEDLAKVRERVERDWAARFDKEREAFIESRELDTDRPLAAEPIDWRWVTFDEALLLAKKEGKLLFVDVMAFWCVWCYRMDYYTYPDAEVARLLNEKFIPVKIIQEQDPAGDYQRVRDLLGARGIPAMGIFAPNGTDGTILHKISGWKKPEAFIEELETALEAAPGRARDR